MSLFLVTMKINYSYESVLYKWTEQLVQFDKPDELIILEKKMSLIH